MAFLKFIFFLLVGFWLVGLIFRATFTRWFNKRAAEYERSARQAQREAQKQARGRREGDVIVENTGTVRKRVSRSVGDYVEFEEVDEVAEKSAEKR